MQTHLMLKAHYGFCADNPTSNWLKQDNIPKKAVPIAMTELSGFERGLK